jgi:hypothetical protein
MKAATGRIDAAICFCGRNNGGSDRYGPFRTPSGRGLFLSGDNAAGLWYGASREAAKSPIAIYSIDLE